MNKIKALRKSAQLTQKALSELLNIPKRTIENWEAGVNEPPAYLIELIEYFLKNENYIKMEDNKMKRALTVYEDTNMYGGAHETNANTARKAAREGRDLIVHCSHYDGQRYSNSTYRVTSLRELTTDGRIIGNTESGDVWEATADLCQYAKTGQI